MSKTIRKYYARNAPFYDLKDCQFKYNLNLNIETFS